MIFNRAFLLNILLSAAACAAQSTLILQNPADAPLGSFAPNYDDTPMAAESQGGTPSPASPTARRRLTVKDAESLAIKSNPQISVAQLTALGSHEVTREVRSNLWPTAYASLTGVDSHPGSRITAGALNNPIIFERAAGGVTVSQLITDFGHTTNLVASARLHEKAQDQNALATRQQVLLAVDQAFYDALQTAAVVRVAEQTVASRQLLSDQVSALTRSKLKSDLDLSFANVNLAQAKLLQLDAENNNHAAMANLSAILGFTTLQDFELVDDRTPVDSPPPSVDQLISEAFSSRPEILAQEFEIQSAQKLHAANRDSLLPTISALGAVGGAPVRDDQLSSWYGAVGVNVQIPIFNGFLYNARAREADLQAQAASQQLNDLRNRISRDVRNSWLNATTAYERVNVNQQLLNEANQALSLAQTRYKLGLSSIVELSQAQLQQTQAEIGGATASYEYRLSLSVLRYQTTGI